METSTEGVLRGLISAEKKKKKESEGAALFFFPGSCWILSLQSSAPEFDT